jgi:hypothetical protein
MATIQKLLSLKILDNDDTSNIINLPPSYSLVSIITPSTIDGGLFTVNASADIGSALVPVWNSGSATVTEDLFTINYGASRYIRLNPADFYGMQRLQLVSDATQNQDVVLTIVIGQLS